MKLFYIKRLEYCVYCRGGDYSARDKALDLSMFRRSMMPYKKLFMWRRKLRKSKVPNYFALDFDRYIITGVSFNWWFRRK